MRMFNLDGARDACAETPYAARVKYLHDIRGIPKQILLIETLSGIKELHLTTKDNG